MSITSGIVPDGHRNCIPPSGCRNVTVFGELPRWIPPRELNHYTTKTVPTIRPRGRS